MSRWRKVGGVGGWVGGCEPGRVESSQINDWTPPTYHTTPLHPHPRIPSYPHPRTWRVGVVIERMKDLPETMSLLYLFAPIYSNNSQVSQPVINLL